MSADDTHRLRSHPQVRRVVTVREPFIFTCARCEAEFYLGGARPLVDGALVCRGCWKPDDAHDLKRCARCGRMCPAVEFAPEAVTDPAMRALIAAFGGQGPHRECRACRA